MFAVLCDADVLHGLPELLLTTKCLIPQKIAQVLFHFKNVTKGAVRLSNEVIVGKRDKQTLSKKIWNFLPGFFFCLCAFGKIGPVGNEQSRYISLFQCQTYKNKLKYLQNSKIVKGRDGLRKEMSRIFKCRCIVRFLQDKMGMNASQDEVISSWPRGLGGVAVNMVLNFEISYTYVRLFQMCPVVFGGALIEINERLHSRMSPHSCENVAATRLFLHFPCHAQLRADLSVTCRLDTGCNPVLTA